MREKQIRPCQSGAVGCFGRGIGLQSGISPREEKEYDVSGTFSPPGSGSIAYWSLIMRVETSVSSMGRADVSRK